jgi:hypothetical protein
MFIKEADKMKINIDKDHFIAAPAEDLANEGTADPAGAEDDYFIHYCQIRSGPRSVCGTVHNMD